MRCFHPLSAFLTEGGSVVFVERGQIARPLTLRCGRCVGCRLERSRQWAVRCMHESQMHPASCFVTLTYDDDHIPQYGSLKYRDFQLFCKRLRKRFGPFRFYMCGEYGDTLKRPHYHACLFGVYFDDQVLFSDSSGSKLYTSALLSSLWTDGFASVGQLSFESAAYVARYVMKKVTGSLAATHYLAKPDLYGECHPITPEFTRMSLKPGIGASWFAKYSMDVYPHDYVILNGVRYKPPRYYDDLLKLGAGLESDDLVYSRYVRGIDACIEDSTPLRLEVQERVALAGLSFKRRNLDNEI